MARAIWKGVIRFGDESCPVKLFSAVEDRTVHFRLLNEATSRPVKQRMINPVTGDEVPSERIRRGYAIEEGVFVVLDDDELDALEPEKSRDIEILRFVEPGEIAHPWYDRPYHLGPDDDPVSYFALTDALRSEDREGVARWTMRNREYVGALRVEGEHLMLITLRHAGEVIPASALDPPAGRAPDARELEMAEQLVAALESEFDPEEYADEYRERVLELIEARAEGKTVSFPRAERKEEAGDLEASLEASLRAARERKSA